LQFRLYFFVYIVFYMNNSFAMKFERLIKKILLFVFLVPFLNGCKEYDNFVTYYNTYYNMERILKESEDEFAFQDEKLRIEPRVFVPKNVIYIPEREDIKTMPPFCREFIVTKSKRQPVDIKLDSMIIKGSKIQARHPKSDYIQGTLYLMAKTFFYKEEWLPCQIKCGEMIDKFPDGFLSPDAHILLAKALLIQRKFEEGKVVLSRTVDVAWQLKRYDILSEAFRIEAELYLFEKDYDKAIRPYKQAIIQSSDCAMKSKWQVDMAALLYKIGNYEKALIEFKKVRDYCPEYIWEFESKVYEAECLAHLKRYYEADKIINKMEKDSKWEEWAGFIRGAKLNIMRMKAKDSIDLNKDSLPDLTKEIFDKEEKLADSLYPNNPSIGSYYFQKAMDYYYVNDLREARNYFAKSKTNKSPVVWEADLMHKLLNQLDRKARLAEFGVATSDSLHLLKDSTKISIAASYYEIGRAFEILKRQDSAVFYYQAAMNVAPKEHGETGKYIFTLSERIRDKDPYTADSLLEVLALDYSKTPYGEEAMKKLGFTKPKAIDNAEDLFESGYNLYKFKNYPYAIDQFDSLYKSYPHSEYAPKSLYTLGWIYEKDLQKYDTAMYYYQILVNKYPQSEYAKDINKTVAMKFIVDSGAEIPDSLKTIVVDRKTKIQLESEIKIDPNLNNPNANQALSPQQLRDKAKKLMENPKELLTNPLDRLKEKGKELLNDPSSLFKFNNPLDGLKKDSTAKSINIDSTQIKTEKPIGR